MCAERVCLALWQVLREGTLSPAELEMIGCEYDTRRPCGGSRPLLCRNLKAQAV